MMKKMIDKLFGCRHVFDKFGMGFQNLNSIGIEYEFQCSKCKQIWLASINSNISVREKMQDKEWTEVLNKYILTKGKCAERKEFLFKRKSDEDVR